MAITTFDGFISQIGSGITLSQPMWGEQTAINTNGLFSNSQNVSRIGYTKNLPSLPSGVTSYIPTFIAVANNLDRSALVAKVINMGSLDISTNVFTDGAVMPTVTELGVSRPLPSPILVEVSVVLNATPGSLQITYKDQYNNTAEAGIIIALTASSAVGTFGFYNGGMNTGDTGVVDITNAQRSGGTTPSGTLTFWGLIPIAIVPAGTNSTQIGFHNAITAFSLIQLGAGDRIDAFTVTNNTSPKQFYGSINFIGNN